MSSCCHSGSTRKAPRWARRTRELIAWALPSTVLVLVPKCPACLAAYVALWSGIGLSFGTAAYLRWAMLFVSVAALIFLIVNSIKKGTDRWHIQ